jgi:hypothetical protein
VATKAKAAHRLKVSPTDVEHALTTLAAYVAERILLVEENRLANAQEAIKLQNAINGFTDEVAKRVKNPAEALYNRLRFTTVPTFMENDGITTIGVEGVGRVHLEDDISIKVEDKEGLAAWLTENNLEDLIKETVNAQTLAASMRARMRENAERVSKMKGVNIDPKDLLPMPSPTICEIKPVVRAVIKK